VYKFTKSVFINRSQKDVFDFLSDPVNMPKWQPALVSAEWTSIGTHDIGSTYRTQAKAIGGKAEYLLEITNWDPPNSYRYRSVKIPLPGSIESSYTLASKNNGTEVTWEVQIETAGLLKFVENMLGKQAEKAEGGNLDLAKQFLEAG